MSTLTTEGDPNVPKGLAAPSIISEEKKEDKPKTGFDKYLDSLGEKYVEKCKEMAQKAEYHIAIRKDDGTDQNVRFTRRHVTQSQLEMLEDLRITADDLLKAEKGTPKQRAANRKWYVTIASFILYNTQTHEMMTENEYDNAVSKDIKPVLDGGIMSEMSGVPN